MEIKLNNSRFLQISIIIISTIIFSVSTIGYWIYLNDNLSGGYQSLNGINKLKLVDNEIYNIIFGKNLNNLIEIEQKIKLFEREFYFLKESKSLTNISSSNNLIETTLLKIELNFDAIKKDIINIRDKKIALFYKLKDIYNINVNLNNKYILNMYQEILLWFSGIEIDIHKILEKAKKLENSDPEVNNIIYIISEAILIDNLLKEFKKKENLKAISDFETLFSKEFYSNNIILNGVFYTILIITVIFLSILIYLVLIEQQLQKQLKHLNSSLKIKVAREVEKNREKDNLIHQQSKLIALGEMIGNIAHHWRQPLNNLAISIQDIENAYYFGELDEEYILNLSDEAMKQINYLSSTIDDFRSFFKTDDINEEFSIHSAVENAFAVTLSGINIESIEILKNISKDIIIHGSKNQYVQVIINLIKNSKDIFHERKIDKPSIHISIYEKDNFGILEFYDNGGGIQENIIDRIFEPYFTTKHQSVGKGLGLYISKMIVEHNFSGEMEVNNLNGGAMFYIKVPLIK
jgi:signal transduction histidine kinase